MSLVRTPATALLIATLMAPCLPSCGHHPTATRPVTTDVNVRAYIEQCTGDGWEVASVDSRNIGDIGDITVYQVALVPDEEGPNNTYEDVSQVILSRSGILFNLGIINYRDSTRPYFRREGFFQEARSSSTGPLLLFRISEWDFMRTVNAPPCETYARQSTSLVVCRTEQESRRTDPFECVAVPIGESSEASDCFDSHSEEASSTVVGEDVDVSCSHGCYGEERAVEYTYEEALNALTFSAETGSPEYLAANYPLGTMSIDEVFEVYSGTFEPQPSP